MKFEIEDEGTYWYIVVSGRWNLDDARKHYSEQLGRVIERQVSRLLFDCHNLTGKITTTDRYYFWNFVSRENLRLFNSNVASPPLRMAVVENESLIDTGKFGETVARNLGMEIFITRETAEALQWLGVDDNMMG